MWLSVTDTVISPENTEIKKSLPQGTQRLVLKPDKLVQLMTVMQMAGKFSKKGHLKFYFLNFSNPC